jgi:uncharacterized damage-inducible protein DinB
MTVIDEQGRLEPPLAEGESATLRGFLDYQRATLEWKASSLDAAGLSARLEPSTMTLGGLLKHMAGVEEYWFSVRLLNNAPGDYWPDVDWRVERGWEWSSAEDDDPEFLRNLWRESVAQSRTNVAQAISRGGLDSPAAQPDPDGSAPSLRWILVHMIEEYARHNGHADLLRESVDGEVGE